MIRVPETPPCYSPLASQKKVMPPATLTLKVAFKSPSLKAIREFGSFGPELPILAWSPANKHRTFFHHSIGFAAQQVRGLRFGSVTQRLRSRNDLVEPGQTRTHISRCLVPARDCSFRK